jgi:PTS system arbutin/cellobiose/salicin-specific IIC component
MGLGGVSLAVAVKTKNSELRQTALAAASSAIVAGLSEPALYGVAVRLKRPMIASVITGFVSGAIAGMGGLASHSMAAPGLFTSVQFIDKDNPWSIAWIVAAMVVAVVLSFVLTLVIGFEDIPEEVIENADAVKVAHNHAPNIVSVPMMGSVMALSDLDDEVFSSGMMGKGIAIRPESGHVVSPVSGTVTTVFPTKHAYGITSDTGIEVLVHVGLDTVSLKGEPFDAQVETGFRVERGDTLVHVDLQAIKDAGLSTDTAIIITNTNDYDEVNVTEANDVLHNEHLIEIV